MRLRFALRAAAARSSSSSPWPAAAGALLRRHLHSHPSAPPPPLRPSPRPSFGIAFDVDGVILLGRKPIGGSRNALRRLFSDEGKLRIPFLFLTNGGGIPESKRALELSDLLGVDIDPLQVVQGHSPFRNLLNRFKDEPIVAVGKGEPACVMSEYGFNKVVSIDEYASKFSDIDPLSAYKSWTIGDTLTTGKERQLKFNVYEDKVKGVFVVSDPVDWGRDIQVLCDILGTGGLPGKDKGPQPLLYFASDDLEYQAAFPTERLGQGAFRIALESIFNATHDFPLKYTSYGKPNPFVFHNAAATLAKLVQNMSGKQDLIKEGEEHPFSTIYMIGHNPKVDINGVIQTGRPWFSILTRTGVFKGKDNDKHFPADLVVDTVEEAVDYILKKELS